MRRRAGAGPLAAVVAAGVAVVAIGVTPSGASGTAWTVTPLAIATGYMGDASSISCPAPGDCVTVGSTTGPVTASSLGTNAAAGAVEVHGAWSPFAPVSAGAVVQKGSLEAVSCWAVGRCLAVGTVAASSGAIHLIAYELNGSTWASLTTPTLPSLSPPFEELSVSCVRSGTCRVMGPVSWSPRGVTERTYVATFVAGSWRTSFFLVPPHTLVIGSISCSTTSRCVALLDTGVNGVKRSYLDSMGPRGWHRTSPTGWDHLEVTALRCQTASRCAAVGTLRSGASVVSAELSGWGTSHVVPDHEQARVASCAPATCSVVSWTPVAPLSGHGPAPSGTVWALGGTTWTPATTVVPSGFVNMDFSDLSCIATQCTVAGLGQQYVGGGDESTLQYPIVATSP